MKIGIDIDDTTLNTVNEMIKYGDIFCHDVLKNKNTKNSISDITNRFYLNSLYGWDDETKFKFFNLYYSQVLEDCQPKQDSPKIIRKLKEEGNKIYFISARLTNIPNCQTENITIDTFKKYDIPYDKIIIAAYDKLKYCLENQIEVFVDDSYEVLESLSNNGIKCYLITTPMNKSVIVSKEIKRVYNWEEIYNDLKEN